jgi:hypothetical protein
MENGWVSRATGPSFAEFSPDGKKAAKKMMNNALFGGGQPQRPFPEKTEARSILPTTAASFSTLFNEQRSFLKMRDTALFGGGQPQRPFPRKD